MIKELTVTQQGVSEDTEAAIILFNDDYNTFDWVINSLMEVCNHTSEQAEQCALIVHSKGKYAVKSGPRKELALSCSSLLERGLTAELS